MRLVPPDQRLTPIRVIMHADGLAKSVFLLMVLSMLAALAICVAQVRGGPAPPERHLAFLSTVIVAAPLLGLTRAAYELVKIAIGLVNLRPAPDLEALAPAFAEAAMAVLLTAAVAAIARGYLLIRRPNAL